METVIRVGFVYLFILGILRVLGKREVGQLTPLELVMLILIPEVVGQALVREDFSMTNAVIAVTTLMSLVYATSVLSYKFRRFEELVEGRPSLLIENGSPVKETMDRERITPEEIASEMRRAGIERIDKIKWAVLETGGKIAFIQFSPDDEQPPTEDEPVR